jgi:hypothetical protein
MQKKSNKSFCSDVSVLFQSSADVGQSLALRSISQDSANLLSSSDVLDLESWGKGELEFVSLLLVYKDQLRVYELAGRAYRQRQECTDIASIGP